MQKLKVLLQALWINSRMRKPLEYYEKVNIFSKQKKMRKIKPDIDFLKDQNEWCMTMFREIKSSLVEHEEEVFFRSPENLLQTLSRGGSKEY